MNAFVLYAAWGVCALSWMRGRRKAGPIVGDQHGTFAATLRKRSSTASNSQRVSCRRTAQL
jgi:hypothetical protein